MTANAFIRARIARIDEKLKNEAAEVLEDTGMAISD